MRAGSGKKRAGQEAHSRRCIDEAYRFATFEVFTVCKLYRERVYILLKGVASVRTIIIIIIILLYIILYTYINPLLLNCFVLIV